MSPGEPAANRCYVLCRVQQVSPAQWPACQEQGGSLASRSRIKITALRLRNTLPTNSPYLVPLMAMVPMVRSLQCWSVQKNNDVIREFKRQQKQSAASFKCQDLSPTAKNNRVVSWPVMDSVQVTQSVPTVS